MVLAALIQQGFQGFPLQQRNADIDEELALLQEEEDILTGNWKPSVGYGEIALKHAQNIPDVARAAGGSLLQQLGEIGRYVPQLSLASVAANLVLARKGGAAAVGKKIRKEAEARIALNQPYIKPGAKGKQYLSDVIRGVEEMAPGLAASLATKTPGPMVMQAFGLGETRSYGEQRDVGRTPLQSLAAAVPSGMAEGLFELPVFKILSRGGTPLLKRVIMSVVGEGASEGATEAVQAAIQAGTIKPDMTIKEYLNRIGYATIVGMGVGGAISIPAHVATDIAGRPKVEKEGEFYRHEVQPAPAEQLALPAPAEQLALPAPDYAQAPFEGAPIIAGEELRFQTLPEKQALEAEAQSRVDLGYKDITRLSDKDIQRFKTARIKREAKEAKVVERAEAKRIKEEQKAQAVEKRDTLFNFIADQGGIKKDEGGDVVQSLGGINPFIPGKGLIIRETGKYPDMIREAAVETGFLQADATMDDLFQAMAQEARGVPFRRPEAVVEPTQQDYIADLHMEADKMGISTEGKTTEALLTEMEASVQEQMEEEDPMLAVDRIELDGDDIGGTFYSGLDPSLISNLFGTKEERAEFYGGLKKVPTGLKALGKNLAGGAGTLFLSIDDALRVRSKIYNMPTISRIADMLYGGTENTYGEAVRTRQTINHNKVERILKPIRKSKSMLDRTVYLIQNPDEINLVKGHADHGAAGIVSLLREERQYMVDAGVDVGEIEGYFPRVYDLVKILKNENAFLTAAKKAYKDTYPDMNGAEISEKAQGWLDNVKLNNAGVSVDGNDFQTRAGIPKPNSLKERILSKKADAIMKEFLLQDPQEVLTQHFIQTAKRAEFERRFNIDAWKQLKAAMIDEADASGKDGAHAAIAKTVTDIMAATGNNVGNMSQGAQDTLAWVKMFGAMAMLPHAVITALPEAFMPALRSGSVKESFSAFTDAYRAIMKDATYLEQKEIAEEVIGVAAKAISDMAAEQRMGGELGTATTNQLMAKYFTATGLHGFTEGMRVSATGVGMRYITTLSKELVQSPVKTKIYMEDLGINPKEAQGFSKWVLESGKMTVKSLKGEGKYQDMYKRAVRRFVDQSVVKPEAAEKPRYASHRLGSLFYYLQSFIYGFQKNIIMRQARGVKHAVTTKGLTVGNRVTLAAPLVLTPIIIGALQYGLGELRDKVLTSETRKDMEPGRKMARAMSRSGYYGQLDPWINMFASLRYRRDPATVLAGPIFGNIFDTFAGFANLFILNSDMTNTQERKAAQQFWRSLVKPTMMTMFSATPGAVKVALIQMVGHPQLEEAFIKAVAGKKGKNGKRRRRKRQRRQ